MEETELFKAPLHAQILGQMAHVKAAPVLLVGALIQEVRTYFKIAMATELQTIPALILAGNSGYVKALVPAQIRGQLANVKQVIHLAKKQPCVWR